MALDWMASDAMDEGDALAQALRARCPLPSLNAALPWDTLPEPEREAWRTLGLAALALCGPAPSWSVLLGSVVRETTQHATARFRPYARHLESCGGWTPCTCGLTALLAEMPV